ncbi:MAG: DNA-binding protein [Clostridium sp.]|nr:DNA-binding protein [Clostridium sp.]
MARLIESGRIEEIIYARFEPGEDILQALYEICIEKDIKTGVIMDGSGSAVNFTYQHFPVNPRMSPTNVVIATMEGKCEISLQGTIGTTVYTVEDPNHPRAISNLLPTIAGVLDNDLDKWNMNGSMGGDGTPYIHAHCTASNKDYTVCGHLMPGTKVASGDPAKPSHFSVVIAKVSGVELQATFDEHGFYQNIVKKED